MKKCRSIVGAAVAFALGVPHAVQAQELMEEVLVTAQKKAERLQDVPIPISVMDADRLADNNQLLIREYANTVPGLNVAPIGFGNQSLTLRGITTGGFTLPTVGITVDDIPFPQGVSSAVPDLDPGDLERIEVLRGPQGTLYGANSMGGLIKYVTKDPSFDGISGRLQAGTTSFSEGDDLGYKLRGSANIPVSDTLAVRASGYTRQDPGYIDNPVLGLKDINESSSYGFRTTALLRPSDTVSVKLSALYDHAEADGSAEVTAGLGDLEQNYVPGIGGYERKVQAYSATVSAKLGGGELVSLSGYSTNYGPNSFDWSSTFSGAVEGTFGVTGAPFYDLARYKSFVQELRYSNQIGDKIDWLVGGFYSRTTLAGYEYLAAADRTTGRIVGIEWILDYPRNYKEYAGFANVTYHFTDRFDIQLGGRQSRSREVQSEFIQSGPFIGPVPSIAPSIRSETNAFTYLVTPSFKVTEDLMVYARFASGYRPGGPNTVDDTVPAKYNPDKTQNYELGLKGEFLDRRVSLDASLFYIDWKNIQIQQTSSKNLVYSSNGSRAKSQGVELNATIRPLERTTVSGWVAYTDAVLTEAFPANSPTYGIDGDRLPYSSRFSSNLSLQQEFSLTGEMTGRVGAMFSYIGDRKGVFIGTPDRQELPSYTRTDLRAGVTRGSWAVDAFVNNLTDKRGLVNGGTGYILPTAFIYTQPRMLGMSVSKTF